MESDGGVGGFLSNSENHSSPFASLFDEVSDGKYLGNVITGLREDKIYLNNELIDGLPLALLVLVFPRFSHQYFIRTTDGSRGNLPLCSESIKFNQICKFLKLILIKHYPYLV